MAYWHMLFFLIITLVRADDGIVFRDENDDTFDQRWQQFQRKRSEIVNGIISSGMLKFALDMDTAINVNNPDLINGNVVFSPLSLASTMAMVLMASSGQTFNEVSRILGLESGVDITCHSEIVHQMLGSLLDQINTVKAVGHPVANYASGVFVEENYPIRPEFEKMSKAVFKSNTTRLNYQTDARKSQEYINAWVSRATGGKIKNMLSDPPSPFTKVILASALYFSGEWYQHFAKTATRREQFSTEPDSKSVFVDMMFNGGKFKYYKDEKLGVEIIGLPYKGQEVTMYVMIPHAQGALALNKFKQSLTPKVIDNLISNMTIQICIVGLPKMKLSSSMSLKEAFRTLNVSSLFEANQADLSILSSSGDSGNVNGNVKQNCKRPLESGNRKVLQDFGIDELRNSGTTGNPGLYAEDVLHKVEIDIDEIGTEAAAATLVSIRRGGDVKRFISERPFVFFIRDDQSRLVWFWGTVNKPVPNFHE